MNRLQIAPGPPSDELGLRHERLTHKSEARLTGNDLVMMNVGILAVDEELGRQLQIGSLDTAQILRFVGLFGRASIPMGEVTVKL